MTIFFDSHGEAWATCEAGHPHAEAFGPLGTARRLGDDEIMAAWGPLDGRTPWGVAREGGEVETSPDGWDHIHPDEMDEGDPCPICGD